VGGSVTIPPVKVVNGALELHHHHHQQFSVLKHTASLASTGM
jgi:hypothetical protein